eukprot:1559502-Prymnesium_polylepis.1
MARPHLKGDEASARRMGQAADQVFRAAAGRVGRGGRDTVGGVNYVAGNGRYAGQRPGTRVNGVNTQTRASRRMRTGG